MQSTSLIRLVFIRVFHLIEYTALAKLLNIEESLVLDLKILMYRNIDEIDKLKKIKADSDKEMLEALQKTERIVRVQGRVATRARGA